MTSGGTRGLAFLFGLFSALLFIVAAVISFVGGFVFLAFGTGGLAVGAFSRSLLNVVFGVMVGGFTVFGRSSVRDRSVAAGVVLVVLALLAWFALGLGRDLVGLFAALFGLIAGILYLVSEH